MDVYGDDIDDLKDDDDDDDDDDDYDDDGMMDGKRRGVKRSSSGPSRDSVDDEDEDVEDPMDMLSGHPALRNSRDKGSSAPEAKRRKKASSGRVTVNEDGLIVVEEPEEEEEEVHAKAINPLAAGDKDMSDGDDEMGTRINDISSRNEHTVLFQTLCFLSNLLLHLFSFFLLLSLLLTTLLRSFDSFTIGGCTVILHHHLVLVGLLIARLSVQLSLLAFNPLLIHITKELRQSSVGLEEFIFIIPKRGEKETSKWERNIGNDPKTGAPIIIKIGKYGPYASIENGDKPMYASLRKNQNIESITIDEVLDLFKLPRELGEYDGDNTTVLVGRFGPYIKNNGKFYALSKTDDPYTISIERAIEIIEAKKEQMKNALCRTFDEEPDMQILKGRFGPYISYQKKNYKIPKNINPEEITLEQCRNIIENAQEKKKK